MKFKEKTCCFTGHREIPQYDYECIRKKLRDVVEDLIEKGVVYIGVGGALGFDTMAALVILELKEIYENIRLILVLPCKNQCKNWKKQMLKFIITEKIWQTRWFMFQKSIHHIV